MPNFKYKVDDAEVVLSPEENLMVKDAIQRGANIVSLRGGKISINVNFIRYIRETNELTPEQEANRIRALPPPTAPRRLSEKGRQWFHDMRQRYMNAPHPESCKCRDGEKKNQNQQQNGQPNKI